MISRFAYYILLIGASFTLMPVAFCQVLENRFSHYTSKDGLADGQINSIIQDKEGFLWMGSKGGLSRFDGHDFKIFRYDPMNPNSLRENGVRDFFLDSANNMWLITANWLYLYHSDGEWFEHFNIGSLATDLLNHICGKENDQIIISSETSLYSFDTKQKRFSFFKYPGATKVVHTDYKRDEDGIMWISRSNNLLRYDPQTKKTMVFDSLGGSLFLLPEQKMLIANYGYGIHVIDRKTLSIKQYVTAGVTDPPQRTILSCWKLNDTTYLIGTLNGIGVFDLHNGSCTFVKPDPLNPSGLLEHDDVITSIYRDREGILWFGGRHLEKYDFADFSIKMISGIGKDHREKPFRDFFSIYRCSNGSFLLGDYNSAWVYEPPHDCLTRLINPALENRIVDNFTEDARGNIWCNTVTEGHYFPKICAFRLNGNKIKDLREYSIPIERGIRDMKLDTKGNIYKTSRNGLVKFDTATKLFSILGARHDHQVRFTSPYIISICAARNGCIWVGTDKGLNKIEKDGTIKQFNGNTQGKAPLPDWYVDEIVEDMNGVIWMIVYDHGIGRVDPSNDSISFLTVQQGLPTNLYEKLGADNTGNLWALSVMGVLKVNSLTLQNHLYTETEGFPNPDEIHDMYFSNLNKRLYLLTDYSIFEIDPQGQNYSPQLAGTVITGFSVFDKERPVNVSNTVDLKYNENFINIRFAALQFHSNGQVKYAYKMEGVDADWVYCNFRRNASYTNLAPGKYVFKVKAQNPAGTWNDAPTELNIFIKAPFWETWWFSLLEAVLASGIIFWIVRLYTSRKLAKQKIQFEMQQAVSSERTRIAADMHDELGAGLTSIRFLSEIANEKMQKNQVAKAEVEKIEHSAAQLSENLREIIWTMNTRFDKLDDFIIYVRTYAVNYFDDTQIQLHFNSPPVIPDIKIAGEVRRNIFLCIKEAFNNIVKHSCGSEASISFEVSGSMLFTTIKDNGIGIDASGLNKFGNGLTTMRERLRKCGGELVVEVDKGTSLIFKAKII